MRSALFPSAAVVLVASVVAAQEQPRFRAGANLVRVDAYVTVDGAAVPNLTMGDFEVLEDGVLQRVESLEFVTRAAGPRSPASADPRTERSMLAAAREPGARLFALFLDTPHVDRLAAQRASVPVQRFLHEVLTSDDLIGVMTPDMSARDVSFSRRTSTAEATLRDFRKWSEARQTFSSDPVEDEITFCYGKGHENTELIREMLARYRAWRTITALGELVTHLENLREERKFVILLSEGWHLLSRRVVSRPQPPMLHAQQGVPARRWTGRVITECSSLVASIPSSDTVAEFQRLLQRANRANVSFYPIDARGLVDAPSPPPRYEWSRGSSPSETLLTLARETDGLAVVGTNDLDGGFQRLVADTGDYYLLGYYSTNTTLDGRFRKITVRVKRDHVEVRARSGYLAPTREEMAIATTVPSRSAPVRVLSVLSGRALRRGPSTGLAYVESKDSEYRRTEKLRFEVAMATPVAVTARLLGRGGTPLNVPVLVSTNPDAFAGQHVIVADVTLAPLAQGQYELELVLEQPSGAEVVPYSFTVIP